MKCACGKATLCGSSATGPFRKVVGSNWREDRVYWLTLACTHVVVREVRRKRRVPKRCRCWVCGKYPLDTNERVRVRTERSESEAVVFLVGLSSGRD